MLILALGFLGVLFMIYGVVLISRMRAEDPGAWPTVAAGGGATVSLHPGWTIEDPGPPARITTGVRGAQLSIEPVTPAAQKSDLALPAVPPEQILNGIVSESGVLLDQDSIEAIRLPAGERIGIRIASAGTGPEGNRGFFEFHLLGAGAGAVLLRYRCPVLSGSIDSLNLGRTAESVRFHETAPPPSG